MKHSEDYGDGYYVGTITSNSDPIGIGRVQANIPGLYNTAKGPVPWIGPIKDSPFGYGTGSKGPYGVYGSPQVGSQIKVELQKGDEHNALYTPLPTAPSANPAFSSPQTWGFPAPSGNQLLVNMASGTWTFTHSSGDTLSYDSSGNRTTLVKGNSTETVNGSMNLTVQGSVNLTATGTASYTASAHQFNGPVTASSTISAAGDITDNVGTGNAESMADMRTTYNEHVHEYDDNGNPNDTAKPTPQIP